MSYTRLRVKINKRVIDHASTRDAFAEVIEIIGVTRVASVKPDLVSTRLTDFPEKIQAKPRTRTRRCGDYYIAVDFSTKRRADYLEEIARTLDIPIEIEIIPKKE